MSSALGRPACGDRRHSGPDVHTGPRESRGLATVTAAGVACLPHGRRSPGSLRDTGCRRVYWSVGGGPKTSWRSASIIIMSLTTTDHRVQRDDRRLHPSDVDAREHKVDVTDNPETAPVLCAYAIGRLCTPSPAPVHPARSATSTRW